MHQDVHAKTYIDSNSKPQQKHRIGTVNKNIKAFYTVSHVGLWLMANLSDTALLTGFSVVNEYFCFPDDRL